MFFLFAVILFWKKIVYFLSRVIIEQTRFCSSVQFIKCHFWIVFSKVNGKRLMFCLPWQILWYSIHIQSKHFLYFCSRLQQRKILYDWCLFSWSLEEALMFCSSLAWNFIVVGSSSTSSTVRKRCGLISRTMSSSESKNGVTAEDEKEENHLARILDSPACRKLFTWAGPQNPSLRAADAEMREEQRLRWNFDFETETPLPGRYQWVPVDTRTRNGEARTSFNTTTQSVRNESRDQQHQRARSTRSCDRPLNVPRRSERNVARMQLDGELTWN